MPSPATCWLIVVRQTGADLLASITGEQRRSRYRRYCGLAFVHFSDWATIRPLDWDRQTELRYSKAIAAVQVTVFGEKNLAHSSLAEFFDDPVVRDGLADHGEFLHMHFAHCNRNDQTVLSLYSCGMAVDS